MSRYKPKPLEGDWEKWIEICDENREQLTRLDTQSRKEGKLLWRYIQEPFADGFALYQITGVLKDKGKVLIEACTGVGDDWQIPYWGEKALIDLSYAEASVERRDAWARLVEKKEEERSTRAIVDDIVEKQVAQ